MLDSNTRYVYEVYRLKSVSAAANTLFVSQPAISAAIRKVEKELGTPLFNRKTLPFTLTPAGKIYMDAVEKQLEIEAQAVDRIQAANHTGGGTLRIVSAAHLTFRIIPKLLKVFHQQHPQVHVQVRVAEVEKLNELLEKNQVDIIVSDMTYPLGYHAVPLFVQRCVVVVQEDTPIDPRLRQYSISRESLINRDYPQEKQVQDTTLFRDVEFIHIPPFPYINRRRTFLLGKFGTTPHITSGTSRMSMNYNLMLAGFGALLTTDAHIAALPPDTGCLHFMLGGEDAQQPFSLIYSQTPGGATNTARDSFIEIAKAYFAEGNPLLKIIES